MRGKAYIAWLLSAVAAIPIPASGQSTSVVGAPDLQKMQEQLTEQAITIQLAIGDNPDQNKILDGIAASVPSGGRYLVVDAKDATERDKIYRICFENPVTETFQTSDGPIDGFVQFLAIRNDQFQSYAQAIVNVPFGARSVCIKATTTLGGQDFAVEPVYSDVASFWTVDAGPRLVSVNQRAASVADWSVLGGLVGGFMGRDPVRRDGLAQYGLKPVPVAFSSFKDIVKEYSPRQSLTMMGMIFGKAAERWVGLRITSVPAGARLFVDGKDTDLSTDANAWIAGSKLSTAQLHFQQKTMHLSDCDVRPASGKIAAQLNCVIR